MVIDDGRLKPETTIQDSEAKLTTLIKQAAGFDASRGDAVSLAILPFATVPPPLPTTDYKSVHHWLDLGIQVMQLVLLLALLLFIVLGCRKLLGGGSPSRPTGRISTVVPGITPGPTVTPAVTDSALPPDRTPVTLEEQVAQYQRLAEDEPEKVAAVLKEWINRNHPNG